MKRRLAHFVRLLVIVLILSVTGASVTAAPAQDFGFFSAGQFPLYVSDQTADVVHQVDASGTASTYVTGFNFPAAMTFDASGNLYVGDDTDKAIYLVPPGGGSKSIFASGFADPDGIAFDTSGNLYVADWGGGFVYLVPPGGGAVGGAVSTYATGFVSPTGIAFDASGNLYVADFFNNVVYLVPPGGGAVGVVDQYATGFTDAFGVTFDASGNLYVADIGANKVYLVPPGGGAVRGAVSTYATGFDNPIDPRFDASGNLYVSDIGANKVYLVPPGGGAVGGAVSTFVALTDARYLAFTPLSRGGPHGDSTGSTTTDSSCWYSANDNGFRGFSFHDQGEQRANGGNHYCSTPITITWDGYKMCAQAPPGYEISGLSINQGTFMDGATCYTDEQGARVDIGLQHINTTSGTTNGAAAVVADESAAPAEAGFELGATGGTFACAAADAGVARVSVPANIVADGTRFLCAVNANPQSVSAPIGYSLLGSRVDLTTDTGVATFDSALTVCLSHTNANILKAGGAAANLRVGFFDGVMWQPLPVTSANANETCGLADHFTQFGLMAATPTALPATGASVAPVVWLVLSVVALASGEILRRRRQLTG